MNKSSKLLSNPVLSLCMIVKNEEQNLPRCLDSVKPYVDEMIVVDTGSEDGTPEIARQYGATVKNFDWCDDFAAARNYALSQASGKWILILDADEELVVTSEDFLDRLTSPSIIVYSLTHTEVYDYADRTPAYLPRFFRNLSELRYVNRFHEQLKYNNKPLSLNQFSYLESLKIKHYGYGKEQVRQKSSSRNIPILERMRQEEGLNLMLLYCLAQMYAEAQQLEKYRECYVEAFDRLLPNLSEGKPPEDFTFIPSLIYALGMQYFGKKDYETAWLLCKRGLEWCHDYPPFNYLAGVILSALKFPLGATAYFENCIQLGQQHNYYKGEPFDLVFMTTHPAYNLGLMYIELGQAEEALAAFKLALSFNANFMPALEKINTIEQFLTVLA